MNGVAHIIFLGGGTVLPARDPYERELLREHVMDRARRKGQVQIFIDGRAWIVRDERSFTCGRCRQAKVGTWCAFAADASTCCVGCALGALGTHFETNVKAHRNEELPPPERASLFAELLTWTGFGRPQDAA